MPEPNYAPVANTPFEEVVNRTLWDRPDTISRLRVAGDLGWLVALNYHETEVESLVGFSTEAVNRSSPLTPPCDVAEAESRRGPEGRVLGLRAPFNADMTAKGLGSKVTNTPQALRPSTGPRPEAVVRAIPFSSLEDIYRRDLAEVDKGPRYRFLRHGFKLLGAMTEDHLTFSDRGSERAIRSMERDYGNKPLVLMPIPPSWEMKQRHEGIEQPVAPQAMLVRGGAFASRNIMHYLGSYQFLT